METKSKKNKSHAKTALLSMSILGLSFLTWHGLLADNSISQIDNGSTISGDTQDKIDELNKRAAVYRQIIEIKQQQTQSLSNQLSIMDTSIDQVQNQIEARKQEINNLNTQIGTIETQIAEKEKLISQQKKLLGDLIQTYYQASQANLATIYLSQGNIASYITNKDRLGQTGDKIGDLVNSLAELRNGLQSQSDVLDSKKTEVVKAHNNLQDQNTTLESTKSQKQILLTQTQGEEQKYQQLLQRVQEQKQELFDIDQYFAVSGLSADSYPKPDSKYFASTDWYFSQKDSKWGDNNIGGIKGSPMKKYGCAVTAVAMVFKEHGVSIDPGKLATESIFSGDLINWYDKPDWLKSWPTPDVNGYSHGNLNWSNRSRLDVALKDGKVVIVFIGKSGRKDGHYVVIHHKDASGKYVVHDPYFGANIFLDTSRALIGAMGVKTSTYIDQMIIYN